MKKDFKNEDFPAIPVPPYPGDAVLDRELALCGWEPAADKIRDWMKEAVSKGQSPHALIQGICKELETARIPEAEARKLLSWILALWNQTTRETLQEPFN